MKEWEFQELIDAVEESFNDYLAKGQSSLDAGSHTIDDFWYFNKSSECVENLIIVTSILIHLIKYQRVFIGTKNLFESTLESISDSTIKNVLSSIEIKTLNSMIKNVQSQILATQLVYNPEEK